MGKTVNTGTATLGTSRCFYFRPLPYINLMESDTRPGTGLVGAGNVYGRRMPAPWPSWFILTPLGCIDRWERCSVPYVFLTRFWKLDRVVLEPSGRKASRCQRKSALFGGCNNSLFSSPMVLTRSPGLIRLLFLSSTGTEQCTFCTHCSPYWLECTPRPGGSLSAWRSCQKRASLRWWIFQWKTFPYVTPSAP